MGKLSKKIKKASLLICALVNASMPILLVSGLHIPLVAVVACNILCSVCMVFFTRADDVESIVVNSSSSEPTASHASSSFEDVSVNSNMS